MWLGMKSIVLRNGAVQATTRSFSFSSFRDSRNFNYAILTLRDLGHQYGISGSESQTQVAVGANERQLCLQATVVHLQYAVYLTTF